MRRTRRLWAPVLLALAVAISVGVRLIARTQPRAADGRAALCERVVDGDTIKLAGGERLRYIGIDSPESVDPRRPVEPLGREASEHNRGLVEGRSIRIELDVQERDRYGRLLGYVYVRGDDGRELFVNAEMVRAGYARVSTYPPNVRHESHLLELEREARQERRGLWSAVD